MKYRKLDAKGDYQLNAFLVNSPDTVGQAVLTRLKLWYGEWFMNTSDGTPYYQDILGRHTNYDLEIQSRILGTQGVTEILSYSSTVSADRHLAVNCTVNTIYGSTSISTVLG